MKRAILALYLICSFAIINAQDKGHNPHKNNDPNRFKTSSIDPVPTDPPTPPAPIPIDGGIGLLLIAGLGYGVKKMKK